MLPILLALTALLPFPLNAMAFYTFEKEKDEGAEE